MKLLYQKKVYVLTILTLVFMLAGCGAQKTEQVEEAATVPVEEAVDGFMEPEYWYEIDDITAIRFIHLGPSDTDRGVGTEEDDYDPYGCRYKVEGEWLIATFLDEEYYRWNIVREEGEIRLLAPNGLQ